MKNYETGPLILMIADIQELQLKIEMATIWICCKLYYCYNLRDQLSDQNKYNSINL